MNYVGKTIEYFCSLFLITYFYNVLLPSWKVISETSRYMQVKGVDVTLEQSPSRYIFIDEKGAQENLNKETKFLLFELSFLDKNGQERPGWFTSPDSLTDYYVFHHIFTYDETLQTLSSEKDIEAMNVLVINKYDVIDEILKTAGMTLEGLYRESNILRNSGKQFKTISSDMFLRVAYDKPDGNVTLNISTELMNRVAQGHYRVTRKGVERA